jgi:hypothetical protein
MTEIQKASRTLQIVFRQANIGDERSFFNCSPDITFKELLIDIQQKKNKFYPNSTFIVHVTGISGDNSCFVDVLSSLLVLMMF